MNHSCVRLAELQGSAGEHRDGRMSLSGECQGEGEHPLTRLQAGKAGSCGMERCLLTFIQPAPHAGGAEGGLASPPG